MTVNFGKTSLSAQTQEVQALKPKEKQVKKQSATELMTEELVTIHRLLKANGTFETLERLEELKKSLQAVANEHYAADEPVTFKSEAGSVLFGARTNQYKPSSPEAVVEALSPQIAIQIATFKVSDLKKYLSPVELAKIGTFDWGSRSMKEVTYSEPLPEQK